MSILGILKFKKTLVQLDFYISILHGSSVKIGETISVGVLELEKGRKKIINSPPAMVIKDTAVKLTEKAQIPENIFEIKQKVDNLVKKIKTSHIFKAFPTMTSKPYGNALAFIKYEILNSKLGIKTVERGDAILSDARFRMLNIELKQKCKGKKEKRVDKFSKM
jgi:hypothetical protein